MYQWAKSIKSVLVVTGVFFYFVSYAQAQSCDAPNPNMTITKPGPSVAANAALFSGVWGGTLTFQEGRGHNKQNVTRCYKLHVSTTDSSVAAVAWCYGTNPYNGNGPQCDKYTATITGNVLAFKTNIGVNASFTSRGTNTVAAEFHNDAGLRSTQGDFQREQ